MVCASECRSREAGDAGELGPGDAPRGLFHHQVEHGRGDFGGAGGVLVHEAGERLDEVDGEYEAFAGQPVLQVLRHGGGGHQQANVGGARAQGLAEKIEDMGGFAGTGGP